MEHVDRSESAEFKAECEVLRDPKVAAFTWALIDLQTAAWSRSWSKLKAARRRIHELTGIENRAAQA